jgi:hypothetical protein
MLYTILYRWTGGLYYYCAAVVKARCTCPPGFRSPSILEKRARSYMQPLAPSLRLLLTVWLFTRACVQCEWRAYVNIKIRKMRKNSVDPDRDSANFLRPLGRSQWSCTHVYVCVCVCKHCTCRTCVGEYKSRNAVVSRYLGGAC